MKDKKIITPLETLTFSMHSNKGRIALLLGSGISTAAGIPTGWQIILDMIKKLAIIQGKNCGDDPAKWYEENFDEPPSYSKLLETLERSTAGRRNLISHYIEPTESERLNGNKQPTLAHKAIAALIAKGYIRVVITTNFDRLLENALTAIGIEPVVIYNRDTAQGASPLMHNQITIIKVNGDYCDTRIKNTDGELSVYENPIKKIIKEVLENFGLLICGWSGEWDIALKDLIFGCVNRRYSTFWLTKQEILNPSAAWDLISHRQSIVVNIEDANSCFHTIQEKMLAIERLSLVHPLNKELAIAQVKQYIEEDADTSLHDLFLQETNRVVEEMLAIYDENRDCEDKYYNKHKVDLAEKYQILSSVLCNMIAVGVYHGKDKEKYHLLWCDILDKLVNFLPAEYKQQRTLQYAVGLGFYCALLVLYTIGMVCVATKQFFLLKKIIKDVKYKDSKGPINVGEWLIPLIVMTPADATCLPNSMVKDIQGKTYTKNFPFHCEVHQVLKEPLSKIHYIGNQYNNFFNKFEIIYGVCYAHLNWQTAGGPTPKKPVPQGLYCLDKENANSSYNELLREVQEHQDNWPLLKAGLAGGKHQTFIKLLTEHLDTSRYL